MANIRIKELPGSHTAATVEGSEFVAVDSETGSTEDTRKMVMSQLRQWCQKGLTAGKALISDSGGAIGTSTVTAAELSVLAGITASTTELNKLDDLDATTAELNKLAGCTATTGELNKLAGCTADTTELNLLDGLEASTAELNVLNGITASTAELNLLDGVTASTSEINKLDGVKRIYDPATGAAGNTATLTTGIHTLSSDDAGFIQCDTTGGSVSITMPVCAAANAGVEFVIAMTGYAIGNSVTIVTQGTNTFKLLKDDFSSASGTSIVLDAVNETVILKSSGTGVWCITGGTGLSLS